MSPAALPLPAKLLPDGRLELLDRLTEGLGGDALWWLSGYAAGLARTRGQSPAVAVAVADTPERLTILYGSQTGNARRTAERVAARIGDTGLPVHVVGAADYPVRQLKDERLLLVVISTQGDGDPPDDARAFVEHLLGPRAPKLGGLRFGVLGLGDSSYPKFCEIGRRLDTRLAELGGERWLARADADLDIDEVAAPWTVAAVDAARALVPARTRATVTPLRPAAVPAFDRDNPFAAPVLVVQKITGRNAARDVRHVELSLEGSGLSYEPGDALGLWPRNAPALVDEVLQVLELDGGAAVQIKGRERPLRDWLTAERELTRIARPFIARHAEHARDATLAALLEPGNEARLAHLLDTMQLVDLLRRHPGAWDPGDFVAALRPLTPRLYSIASSPLEVGDEAHLTVAHVAYETQGLARFGAASGQLARTPAGDALPVFIERNERFRLPADTSRDVLMIGAGTGVAPFRGFVQHRAHVDATGRNWLVFGAPHARSDFLYQTEWQQALKRGHLHALDLAFSRDQPDRVYVQHRLEARGREVFDWLEGGTHLYVCGGIAMSKDVHAALLRIVEAHGARRADDAAAYLDGLMEQGRYSRDVY